MDSAALFFAGLVYVLLIGASLFSINHCVDSFLFQWVVVVVECGASWSGL